MKENKIEVIKIEEGDKASVLDILVQNVIDVKPPFKLGKNNSSSGHGFKDAVIWETFNHSNTISDYANVILLTDDSDFDGCESKLDGVTFKITKSNVSLIDDLALMYAAKLLQKKYTDLSKNQYLLTNLKQMIASELGFAAEDVEIVSITESIIDKPAEIKQTFSSSGEDEDYFENMVCFVSKVKIKGSEYRINILIDLGSNEIDTIQVGAAS